jgi:hypothetical protein
MGGLVWFDNTVQACQGPTSFIAYERGLVIFEYSHVFRSGGSLMSKSQFRCIGFPITIPCISIKTALHISDSLDDANLKTLASESEVFQQSNMIKCKNAKHFSYPRMHSVPKNMNESHTAT